MGIDLLTAKFLASEARRGVDFTRTLTLGRQSLCMEKRDYLTVFPGGSPPESDPVGRFADDFLAALGAETVDAIDISSYEGANIIHDLNTPLVIEPGMRWTCVFDGGALEHIFHFPSAIKNCMEATAVGGHFLSVCPWTGFAGHGFYQFSPELLYRALSPANGFKVERMLFRHGKGWREIIDPQTTRRRFEYQSRKSTLLFVSARRIAESEIFARPPQQSDYVVMWEAARFDKAVPGLARRVVEALFPVLASRLRAWRNNRRILEQGSAPARL